MQFPLFYLVFQPFDYCLSAAENDEPEKVCVPSPCGAFATCKDESGVPTCACLPNYRGSPPNCRPECATASECPGDETCVNERCINPCPNACGFNSICNVNNHIPQCRCIRGYEGDAFVKCEPTVISRKRIFLCFNRICSVFNKLISIENQPKDPCYPSPCGPNTQCLNGVCSCISDYIGDPYVNCQPECLLNAQCMRNQACIQNKCVDPCAINPCGREAICNVFNHVAMCYCPYGMTGNPNLACSPVPSMTEFIN